MKTRLAITKIFLVLSSVLLAFVIGELVLRAVGKAEGIDFRFYLKELKNPAQIPADLIVPDRLLGWKLKADVRRMATTSDFSVEYKINSKGLRDKDYDVKKPNGKVRILAFGDSVTFGEGVASSERFTDIAAKSLANAEVINFGVPGYSLSQILSSFENDGLKYDPDYCIVFVTFPIVRREVYIGMIPTTLYVNRLDGLFRRANPIVENSYLLSYLDYFATLFSIQRRLRHQNEALLKSVPEKKARSFDLVRIRENSVTLMTRFSEVCRQHGIKLLIVNISAPRNGLPVPIYFFEDLGPGTPYYDLSSLLAAESRRHRLSFTFDLHYNPRTHRLIGNKVAEILKKEMP